MASPAPVDVGDALDDLINQFSDPMSFFRELIQNALDAGSGEVDVEFEFEASARDPDAGAMIVNVQDYGEGMDREIIDNKLTRLFSSAKDGDMTKIGKFGIGFVSVFAIEPDAVCVDTARSGEAWRVLFDRERNFKRLRLDQAMEGTNIRIIKNSTRADFDAFVTRARQVIRYWCGHANGEVRVCGELVSEPFGLEAPVSVVYQDEFSHIHIGHRDERETLHAFFNGGLTLVQADHNHGTAIADLIGLSFKVSSRYLEHTLTRDDVIKDSNFDKVVRRLRELAREQLRARVFEELDAAVREWTPPAAGLETPAPRPGADGQVELAQDDPLSQRFELLYDACQWHLADEGGLPRALAKYAAARSPSGQIWTWGDLRKAARDELFFAARRTPLSDAVEDLGQAVVCSYGPIHPLDGSGLTIDETCVAPMIRAVATLAKPTFRAHWLATRWCMPLEPDRGELRAWAGLGSTAQRLLDDCGHRIAEVAFGHFEASGSLLEGRAAVSQREYGEATPIQEAGELGTGLFSRRRVLVVDADHPTVRVLLGLSVREPELAAYQLVKLFMLLGGSIPAALDSRLANVAMHYRELRCPKPLS